MTDGVGKSKWILACVFVIGLGNAQSASAATGHGGEALTVCKSLLDGHVLGGRRVT